MCNVEITRAKERFNQKLKGVPFKNVRRIILVYSDRRDLSIGYERHL